MPQGGTLRIPSGRLFGTRALVHGRQAVLGDATLFSNFQTSPSRRPPVGVKVRMKNYGPQPLAAARFINELTGVVDDRTFRNLSDGQERSQIYRDVLSVGLTVSVAPSIDTVDDNVEWWLKTFFQERLRLDLLAGSTDSDSLVTEGADLEWWITTLADEPLGLEVFPNTYRTRS